VRRRIDGGDTLGDRARRSWRGNKTIVAESAVHQGRGSGVEPGTIQAGTPDGKGTTLEATVGVPVVENGVDVGTRSDP
jgi:hypothetical protein